MTKNIYLGNAFSLQMLDTNIETNVNVKPVTKEEVANAAFESVVGHQDTAAVLSHLLGKEVACQRKSVSLGTDDVLYVAQVIGGRLPEGATSLPEGMQLTFLKVTLI